MVGAAITVKGEVNQVPRFTASSCILTLSGSGGAKFAHTGVILDMRGGLEVVLSEGWS